MSDEKKKEVLINAFEQLKTDYKNQNKLSEIVVNMFKYDTEMGLDMWKYLLHEYEGEVKKQYPCFITSLMFNLEHVIGKASVRNLILSDSLIKKSIFEYSGYGCTVTYAAFIVKDKISAGELQEANELLELLYNNPYRELSWYDVLYYVISDTKSITDEGYELLEIWGEKIDNETERAKFTVDMLKFC